MAKVWKRKDRDIWVVDYRDATGKRRRKVGGTTREDAELVAAQLTLQVAAAIKHGTVPVNPDHEITLNDHTERWLKTVTPYLAQRTHRSYTYLYVTHVRPTLGAMKLRDIRPLHVTTLLEERRLTLGKNTVRLIKATLSTLFKWAVKHELMAVNPALGRFEEPGKRKRSAPVRSLSHDQVAQLKQTMETMRQDGRLAPMHVMLFSTMAGTGLRPSEALALQPGDLDLSRRRLRVERALDYDGSVKPTKTDETREVDLSDALTDALRDYVTWLTVESMARGRAPVWLFADAAGRVLSSEKIRPVFQRVLKVAGLPHFIPYDLRHTFASLLLSANVPLLYVAKMLGHAKATTTLQYYARWMPDEEQRYVNVLEKSWHQNLAPKTEELDNQGQNVEIRLIENQPFRLAYYVL